MLQFHFSCQKSFAQKVITLQRGYSNIREMNFKMHALAWLEHLRRYYEILKRDCSTDERFIIYKRLKSFEIDKPINLCIVLL